jgi:hypothetical protein
MPPFAASKHKITSHDVLALNSKLFPSFSMAPQNGCYSLVDGRRKHSLVFAHQKEQIKESVTDATTVVFCMFK